ncbi:hypothetical protein [Legionella sainthelensi]|uniref:Uncharacterized protein n=1 Tax=Legionella sainthelensi TaxID=28087 RepID=A0A2H5FKC2_9GAMM|nr:hypothetical protein [Legionella sainthelensi]AUH71970.1 hypothetical protein CAB17_07735 [Legionella sainthelensi]
MKFKDITSEELIKKINALKKGAECHPMWGTIFLTITPNQNKVLPLEREYKPQHDFAGRISQYYQNQRNNKNFVQKAEEKLRQNNFYGQYYNNNEASLKSHLNLNNIGELDEKIVLGLIKLLIDEAESNQNGAKFFFKIIQPSYNTHDRFKNTDQITIYFDKYSSLSDIVRLSQKIESYLSSKIPENTIKLGPKDSFGFNSFVSARFDTNKLLAEYCEYPFFDLELKKFFDRYSIDELNHIPIGALEAVFNKIITSEQITNLGNREHKALSEQDSQFVQTEFDIMVHNPKNYLDSVEENNLVKEEQKREIEQINEIKQTIYKFNFDFNSCNTAEEINEKLKEKTDELENHAKSLLNLQKTVDSTIYDTILQVIAQKNLHLREAAQASLRNLGSPTLPISGQESEHLLNKPSLNPHAVKKFEQLLKKIKDKADELTDLTSLGLAKKQVALSLYTELSHEFQQYKSGGTNFETFKNNCDNYIKDARPTLEIHRDGGWKELFVNILKTIASLGTIPLYNYCSSQGTYFFSPVKTDSINRVEKVESAINDFQEKADQPPLC